MLEFYASNFGNLQFYDQVYPCVAINIQIKPLWGGCPRLEPGSNIKIVFYRLHIYGREIIRQCAKAFLSSSTFFEYHVGCC